MNLQEATMKVLQEVTEQTNQIIYKIILKDGSKLDTIYTDLKQAQDEAEKLDAKNVLEMYRDNSLDGLFGVFLKDEHFRLYDFLRYEDKKLYYKDNFGWHIINNQRDYYKLTVKVHPFILGKEVDPYSVPYENAILIIDTRDGSVYSYENYEGDYQPLKEYKEELQKVLDGTYGERLYQPYYWDPFDFSR